MCSPSEEWCDVLLGMKCVHQVQCVSGYVDGVCSVFTK